VNLSRQTAALIEIAQETSDPHINACCGFLVGAHPWPGQYDGLTVESAVEDLRLLMRCKLIEMDRRAPIAVPAPVPAPKPEPSPVDRWLASQGATTAPTPKSRGLELGGIVLTLDPYSPGRR
jgi:hypothetical protein